jgi:hypothetical protein
MNLLLLDLAWAGVPSDSYHAVDDSLFDDGQPEEKHVTDLALAAVFNDKSRRSRWDGV